MIGQEVLGIRRGQRLKIVHQNGGEILGWEVEYRGKIRKYGTRLLKLEVVGEPEIVNRREVFRVKTCNRISYSDINEPREVFEGHLDDISQIGVGFYSNTKHMEGANLLIRIDCCNLNLGGILEMQAEVVRSSLSVEGDYTYRYGAKIDCQHKERLLKFIMSQQRIGIHNKR